MDLHESEDSLAYVVSSGLPSAMISDLFLATLSSRVQKPCFNISASLPVLRLFPIVMETCSAQAWSWVHSCCDNKVPLQKRLTGERVSCASQVQRDAVLHGREDMATGRKTW